jgi:alkylation response protein AidB-like acyl-CoA dehydrogenase
LQLKPGHQPKEKLLTVTPVAAPPFLASKLAAYQLELIEAIARTHEVAKFCSINAAQIDRNGVSPEREFELIAKAGLLTAPLRRELGGLGLGIDASSIGELLTILQAIGYRSELVATCGNAGDCEL